MGDGPPGRAQRGILQGGLLQQMSACRRRRSRLAGLLLVVVILALGALILQASPTRHIPQANWSRSHYRNKPQAIGCKSCRRTQSLTVTIVAARNNEDTSWLDVYLGRIEHMVYQVIDANAEYTTSMNKGKEAMPYLQYIIDQYDDLPDISVFTHGAMCDTQCNVAPCNLQCDMH